MSIFMVLLAGAVHAGGVPPTIAGPSARPSFITPNGDGTTEDTEIAFTPGSVDPTLNARVEVYDAAADTLVTVVSDSTVPVDLESTVTWAPVAGVLDDGDYRVDVVITDNNGSVTGSVTVRLDTVAPVLTFGAVGPDPFDPAAAPPANEIRIPIDVIGADATTLVRVFQSGLVVDTLGTFVGAGGDTLSWDGNNSVGGIANSGDYDILALGSDLAGNADSALITVTLDRDAPVFGTTNPTTIQTDSFPVTIAGQVTDLDRVESVKYSLDDGKTFRDDGVVANTPAASVQWSASITVPSPSPGVIDVIVRAQDRLGHTSEVTHEIAYDTTMPQATSTTVIGSGTVTDGDKIKIRTNWNLSGLDVSADFSTIDFDYRTNDETVVEDASGSYLIEYRVSPANIRSSGSYTITVSASTGVLTAMDTVSVDLDATGTAGDELVAISANRFDPEAGESVSMAASGGGDAVRVEVFNVAGQPVRVLEGVGYVDWDGRGDNGQTVASGVYFLRVVVDEAEEIRKVAVLRGGGS